MTLKSSPTFESSPIDSDPIVVDGWSPDGFIASKNPVMASKYTVIGPWIDAGARSTMLRM